MARIVIVHHSGYGHTARLAGAVAQGAGGAPGASVESLTISADGELADVGWQRLAVADAIVFGSPTYMGSFSWQFKRFADASSKVWAAQGWRNKWAGGFTNSASLNGDKHATLAAFVTLAMQHGMVWIGTGMMPANTKAATREDLNHLGAFTGLMAQSPADASPDEAPFAGDLETARRYGARIARMAATGLPA